ncbi:hypothetical protein JO379_000483 [Streptomyces syringium]|uniref:Uncharacterized protein n=1 Tax=Streptomyces syringium TaxID=76729 RepID=A0ABS4XWY2_9ACTN|nr:hypothetical protein [Streptomyces syringium]
MGNVFGGGGHDLALDRHRRDELGYGPPSP